MLSFRWSWVWCIGRPDVYLDKVVYHHTGGTREPKQCLVWPEMYYSYHVGDQSGGNCPADAKQKEPWHCLAESSNVLGLGILHERIMLKIRHQHGNQQQETEKVNVNICHLHLPHTEMAVDRSWEINSCTFWQQQDDWLTWAMQNLIGLTEGVTAVSKLILKQEKEGRERKIQWKGERGRERR